MKLLTAFFVLVATAVAVTAQEDDKCDTPKQWEGIRVEVTPARSRERFSFISYDETGQRTRIYDDTKYNGSSNYYIELFLHQENMGYRVDLKTGECNKFQLTEPFFVIGVSEDDELVAKAEIGSNAQPGEGIEINIYEGHTERGTFYGQWIQPGEGKLCVPVSWNYYSQTTTGYASYNNYYNITLGIKDPTVFNVPPQCTGSF